MEKEKKRLRKRFSKDREAIKDIGGFRFRGCLRISNPCGITTRKKAREREERADQSARYLTNTVCWPPRTKRETIRRIFTHARRWGSRTTRRWLDPIPEKPSHASLKTLKPLLPSFHPPPFILMNENRSGFRVCAPLVAHRSLEEDKVQRGNAAESCDENERERKRESFRRPYLFSWDEENARSHRECEAACHHESLCRL